jgi:hypothetical protein
MNRRAPGSLSERFWSIAKSTGPLGGDDTTNPEPAAVVRHVLRILDALSAGAVGDGVSTATVSFLQMLRQQEQAGDLSYASPEQARGESLDERSLVFSVGVLMFEELTGRHPFGALASGRRISRIQKGELGSGVQYFPQVPAQLRNVLMKAMGPFPEERFKSLDELRDQLERFAEGRPEDSAPARLPRRPLRGLAPTHADLAFATVEEATTKVRARPQMPRATPSQPLRAVSVLQPPRFSPAVPSSPPLPPVISSAPPPPPSPRRTSESRPVVAAELPMAPLPTAPVIEAEASYESESSAEPTQVVNTAPVHHETDRMARVDAPTPRAFAVLERAAYVACGAFAALLLAYFALRPRPATPPAVVMAAGRAPVAAPSQTGVGGNAPVVTPAPARNVEPPALPASDPSPVAFDAELGGRNAAKAARECFSPERAAHTIAYGIGIMWGSKASLSHRMFLGAEEPLSPEERRCVAKTAVGVSGGAAPGRATIVDYRIKLKPDGSNEVRAAIQK